MSSYCFKQQLKQIARQTGKGKIRLWHEVAVLVKWFDQLTVSRVVGEVLGSFLRVIAATFFLLNRGNGYREVISGHRKITTDLPVT